MASNWTPHKHASIPEITILSLHGPILGHIEARPNLKNHKIITIVRSRHVSPRACRIRHPPLASNQTPNYPLQACPSTRIQKSKPTWPPIRPLTSIPHSENSQKLKLYGLKSDPLQECPNLRNQKSKLYGLKLDPLQACLNPTNHNPKPTWPHIRPHRGTAKSKKCTKL
jgi:hypothetical protein